MKRWGSELEVVPCRTYGSYVCGEGGEYESLTLDCPLFLHARIVLEVADRLKNSRLGTTRSVAWQNAQRTRLTAVQHIWHPTKGFRNFSTGALPERPLVSCQSFSVLLVPAWQAWEKRSHSPGDIAPVGVLRPTSFRLQPKDGCRAELRADVIDVPSGASVPLDAQG